MLAVLALDADLTTKVYKGTRYVFRHDIAYSDRMRVYRKPDPERKLFHSSGSLDLVAPSFLKKAKALIYKMGTQGTFNYCLRKLIALFLGKKRCSFKALRIKNIKQLFSLKDAMMFCPTFRKAYYICYKRLGAQPVRNQWVSVEPFPFNVLGKPVHKEVEYEEKSSVSAPEPGYPPYADLIRQYEALRGRMERLEFHSEFEREYADWEELPIHLFDRSVEFLFLEKIKRWKHVVWLDDFVFSSVEVSDPYAVSRQKQYKEGPLSMSERHNRHLFDPVE